MPEANTGAPLEDWTRPRPSLHRHILAFLSRTKADNPRPNPPNWEQRAGLLHPTFENCFVLVMQTSWAGTPRAQGAGRRVLKCIRSRLMPIPGAPAPGTACVEGNSLPHSLLLLEISSCSLARSGSTSVAGPPHTQEHLRIRGWLPQGPEAHVWQLYHPCHREVEAPGTLGAGGPRGQWVRSLDSVTQRQQSPVVKGTGGLR